jgi:hypothetical protein
MLVRLLNLILPGTGLILLRREWLGFCLAMVFGISGNIALAGWLIAPLAVPPALTTLALLLAIMSWLAAQLLLHREIAEARRQSAQLQVLLQGARASLGRGDLEAARLELEGSLALDAENAEVYWLRAQLCRLSDDERGASENQEHAESLQQKHRRRARSSASPAADTPADGGAPTSAK